MVIVVEDNCLKIELIQNVTASWVKGKLEEIKEVMVGEDPYEEIVVDMEKVEVMDSIGVSLIIGLYKTSQELGKDFKVVGLKGRVKNLFTLMKLDEIFFIEE